MTDIPSKVPVLCASNKKIRSLEGMNSIMIIINQLSIQQALKVVAFGSDTPNITTRTAVIMAQQAPICWQSCGTPSSSATLCDIASHSEPRLLRSSCHVDSAQSRSPSPTSLALLLRGVRSESSEGTRIKQSYALVRRLP